ncbi:MAG: hypothetical protein V4649_05105 [Bacteroidota bacterium]
MDKHNLLRRIRFMICLFVILLILSGATAFATYTELKWIIESGLFSESSLLGQWLYKVWLAVKDINDRNPLLFYGYDWLAFAHIVIGLAFIGPYRDPVRNKWVIDWGIISCICVIPLAVIAGPVRGIPWYHILIDCAFGVIGIVPLLVVRRWIGKLERLQAEAA